MKNVQEYCDNCGKRTQYISERLTVTLSSIGSLSLDLCSECAERIWKEYAVNKTKTGDAMTEPFDLRNNPLTPWRDSLS